MPSIITILDPVNSRANPEARKLILPSLKYKRIIRRRTKKLNRKGQTIYNEMVEEQQPKTDKEKKALKNKVCKDKSLWYSKVIEEVGFKNLCDRRGYFYTGYLHVDSYNLCFA